ncbi:serine hydrolase domain-containing protein [Streptomyces sp. NBC_01264]|uniref:serine hydrolase domain-containing protein n=1 Tax=Streptomyces sp. NBC_01264 TaxID=2903804 RepID=UPI002259999F|nr:serine hydrolase domain-containing protein [Streptomyces sp. NBC_01264]MCX4781693.1 beta-lactamase family protein [Streptomyces sp. NBC_01264]
MEHTLATVSGTCDARFKTVLDVLEERLESGEELGASLHVDIDGEAVVDLWGGFRDVDRAEPWTRDTLTNVWSTTKAVTSLAALVLVNRGLLDVHAPVSTYWPEFGANGKESVLVRHVLSHTSGVSGWEKPCRLQDIYRTREAAARLAEQAPWWEPGTASGYHGLNYGHLVGELVRRTTGRSLRSFVATELAGPLGADFQIGAVPAVWNRIADLVPPAVDPHALDSLDPESPMYKTLTSPLAGPDVVSTEGWRRAEIGAANGHGTAAGIARLLSVVSRGGTVDGLRLLSPETIDLIFEEQASGVDLVIGLPMRWGMGFALPGTETFPYVPRGRRCFWGGWGGSVVCMDLERRMTMAYTMNRMGAGVVGSDRTAAYVAAVFDAAGAV